MNSVLSVPAYALRVLRPSPIAVSGPSSIARSGAALRSVLLAWLASCVHAWWWAVRHSSGVCRTAGTSEVPWLLRISGSSLRSWSAPLFGMVPACAGVPHPHRAQNLAGCRPRQGGSFVKRSFMNTPFTRAVPCETLASKRDGGLPRFSSFDVCPGLCWSAHSPGRERRRSAPRPREARPRFISKTL